MVRFSEIAIKSTKTRKWLTSRLISHINYLLKLNTIEDFEIIKEYSRVFVKSNENAKVKKIISNLTPGAVSTSEVYQCSSDLEHIQECVKEFFHKIKTESSYAVKVKRTGKHSFTSVELGAKIGDYIWENNEEKRLSVDLTNPDYALNIEVRDDKAYVFDETLKGIGGLPVGSQGKVVVIVTGEHEDLSNIIQLYKRGAITLIYAIVKNLKEDFKDSVMQLLSLQPQLEKKEIHIAERELDKTELMEYYHKNECLGIGVSKAIFDRYEKEIPVSIPLFVPHLITEVDKEEIAKVLTPIN